MIIRKLRLKRGWSQEQLSEMSGLSVRTIQRIERGQKPSLESLKSLAAVFEIDINELHEESTVNNHDAVTREEEEVIQQVKELKAFYTHLTLFAIIMPLIFALNIIYTPEYIWAFFPLLGWGCGLVGHATTVFEWPNMFSADWERKQIEKRLGRKL